MKKKIIKEPKQNGLTMRQIESNYKKSKGNNKIYWKGRIDSFKNSLKYQKWIHSLNCTAKNPLINDLYTKKYALTKIKPKKGKGSFKRKKK